MSPEAELLYESRVRNRQMVVAIAAGVLYLAGTIVGLVGPHAKVDELTLGLITDHRRGALDVISAVVDALAEGAICWTLLYLFRCAKARSQRTMPFVPALIIVGTGLAAIAGVINAFVIMSKVNDFVGSGMQTYDEANRLTSGAGLLILQIAQQFASLIVAIAFVLVALQAMRVGLLPRFLGYIGMLAGALILFPIIVVPVVQLYFLVCVGLLAAGLWPSGAPQAWITGRAEAWPSSAEMRARRMAAAEANRERRGGGRRSGRGSAVAELPPEPELTEADGDRDTGAPARPATPQRRKRKHRR